MLIGKVQTPISGELFYKDLMMVKSSKRKKVQMKINTQMALKLNTTSLTIEQTTEVTTSKERSPTLQNQLKPSTSEMIMNSKRKARTSQMITLLANGLVRS